MITKLGSRLGRAVHSEVTRMWQANRWISRARANYIEERGSSGDEDIPRKFRHPEPVVLSAAIGASIRQIAVETGLEFGETWDELYP